MLKRKTDRNSASVLKNRGAAVRRLYLLVVRDDA